MIRYFITLALCLCFGTAQSGGLIGSGIVSGGGWSCSSGSIYVSYEDVTDSSTVSLDSDSYVQSISPTSNIDLHSITVLWGYANSTCEATMRIGTSTDLTTYLAESSNSAGGSGWSTIFDFTSDELILLGANTYYIGLIEVAGDCRWSFGRNTSDTVYPDGTAYDSNVGWVAQTTAAVAARDRHFRIYSCD